MKFFASILVGQPGKRSASANKSRAFSATFFLATAAALLAADGGPVYRVGVLNNGTLRVKDNMHDAQWTVESENVTSFALEGDRIGVRTRDGNVLVKEGGLNVPWVQVAQQTQNFALSGDRIAILNSGGSLDVKEGDLEASWVRVSERTQDFQMQNQRIAILMWGGVLQMQEGALNSTLVHVTDGVKGFQMAGRLLGVLYTNGSLELQEGGLDAPWVHQATGVQSFYITNNRVGILRRGGTLQVKDAVPGAPWVTEADGVSSFKMSGDRIGVVQSGVLSVKSGGLNGEWNQEAKGVSMFALQDTHVVFQGARGAVFAKDGPLDAPWVTLALSAQKFQFARVELNDRSADLNSRRPRFESESQVGAAHRTDGTSDWHRGAAPGEITKALVFQTAKGPTEGGSTQVEVAFPAGYTYCRHTLSANHESGRGGVSIVSAEQDRLVFALWSAHERDGANLGGVKVDATVTGVSDSHLHDGSCNALPLKGGGCAALTCENYIDAAETDNGQCVSATCAYNRADRQGEPVCVYNLRSDGEVESRARILACNVQNSVGTDR